MLPATLFCQRKGVCSIAETNGSHFSLQGIAHAHWSLVSLDIHRIMHENLYITFRTFPYEPFHEKTAWVVHMCLHPWVTFMVISPTQNNSLQIHCHLVVLKPWIMIPLHFGHVDKRTYYTFSFVTGLHICKTLSDPQKVNSIFTRLLHCKDNELSGKMEVPISAI